MPRKRNSEKAMAAIKAEPKTLAALNAIIARSESLVPGGTRAVLGEGPVRAAIAFVGEQPGDAEDREGRPFVGPAGQLLDRAMSQAGIERKSSYLTNAVKHFKFEQRGKRRIHQKPTAGEVETLSLVADEGVGAGPAEADCGARSHGCAGACRHGSSHHAVSWSGGLQGFPWLHHGAPSYLLRLRGDDRSYSAITCAPSKRMMLAISRLSVVARDP
jgi:hypothetical protein